MIVMCEGCETNFQVEDRLIKPTGSKVRCSKCRHVFVAYPPVALTVPEEPLILSDELPTASSNSASLELPDIGSELDAIFSDEFNDAADASADQEPELLDVDDLLAEDVPPASALAADTPEDDLKLDLDLDLISDEDLVAKVLPSDLSTEAVPIDSSETDAGPHLEPVQMAVNEETLASLDELGIKLDSLDPLGEETMPAAGEGAEAAAAEPPELELDLDGLMAEDAGESPLEFVEAKPEEVLVGDSIESPTVASEAVESVAEAPPANEGELDLSDLEAMLEGNSQGIDTKSEADEEFKLDLDTSAAAVDAGEQTGDFEELDLTAIAGEASVAAESDDQADKLSDEIDFALDLEEGAEPASAAAESAEPQDDELDFSDITNILEEPPIETEKSLEEAPLEIDLLSSGDSVPAESAQLEPSTESPDGLLLDLESLLEDEEGTEVAVEQKAQPASEDLDLDLAVGATPETTDDLEIEIEPVSEEAESESPVEAVAEAAVPPNEELPAATDQLEAEKVTDTVGIAGVTDVLDMEPAAAAGMPAEAVRQSGIRKYLLAAAALLVLVIAALIVPRSIGLNVPFLSDLEIPFLGKIFQTEPEDIAGNLKMAPIAENLTAEFIEHPGAGRLCVIKGQVRNNYDHPRSAIRVTAKLYTKDKTLAKTATVYAGNVMSNQELASQDLATITARMKNKEGANNMNVGVKPGRSIPFMAVFDNLPNNLDEYSVEVAGSTK